MKRLLVLSLAMLLTATMVYGQTTVGAIRVEVNDADGSLLPGVTVIAQTPEALGSRTAITDATGVALLTGLEPSKAYTVTAALDGFNTARFENILVTAGRTTGLHADLELAAVEAEIVVVGEAPVINFTNAITGQDITLELTESLPTGRSYQSYLQLVPGVSPIDPTWGDENPAARSGLNYADIRGEMGRSRDNFYYIEGIDVTDAYSGFTGADLNTEIIQEQSVITGGIPAEYIGAPGLVSSVITKSGGNDFHGTVNYFWQGSSLQSDNKHADESTFTGFDAAATLGGPIVRDKLWFFASFRRVDRDDDVSSLDTNEYLRTVNRSADQGFAKVSWNPTGAMRFTGTYLTDPREETGSTDRDVQNNFDRAYSTGGNRYILNYSQVFGPAYLSVSAGKHDGEESYVAALPDIRNDVYFRSGDDFSQADEQLGGWGEIRGDERNNEFIKGKFEYYAGTSWGDHTLSFGAEYLKHIRNYDRRYTGGAQYASLGAMYAGAGLTSEIYSTEATAGGWTGTEWSHENESDYSGTIIAINASPNRDSFYALLDTNGDGTISPDEMGAVVFDTTSGNPQGMVNYYRITTDDATPAVFEVEGTTFYAQDTWQRKRWTVNIGARAESWTHFATTGLEIAKFDYEISPRLGIVYDVKGDGRHKLSGFYGRYYDPIRMNMTAFAGTLSGFLRKEQVYINGEWLTYRLRGGTTTQDAFFSPNTKTPYTDDLQLGYQVQLGTDMSIEVLLMRRQTRDIMEDYDLGLFATRVDGSTAYPGPTDHPDSLWLGLDYFGYDVNPGSNFVIMTLANSQRNWDGLELVFRKRYNNRWQMLASYTYADAEGNSNSDSNADLQGDVLWLDPNAPNTFGPQPGSINHLIKAGGSYTFDFGLQLGGTWSWNSGTLASATYFQYARNLPIRVEEAFEYAGFDYRWNEPGAIGGFENDSFMTFDVRASYNHDFGPVNAQFFVDIFNLLDDQAATRNQDLVGGTGATDYGDPLSWVFPRRIYLGARLNF